MAPLETFPAADPRGVQAPQPPEEAPQLEEERLWRRAEGAQEWRQAPRLEATLQERRRSPARKRTPLAPPVTFPAGARAREAQQQRQAPRLEAALQERRRSPAR